MISFYGKDRSARYPDAQNDGGPISRTPGKDRSDEYQRGQTGHRRRDAEAQELGPLGRDDQIGTLNQVTPEDIVKAAGLICTLGKVFALGIPLDRNGPQTGLFGGRWIPIHTMLATGTDAVAGRYDKVPNIRYAHDAINLPVQCRHPLGFARPHLLRGQDVQRLRRARSRLQRPEKLGIEHTKNKMVGRGVLLDVARFRGVPWLKDGEAIANEELDRCAKDQNVEIRSGDFVILRTGQMERCLSDELGHVCWR